MTKEYKGNHPRPDDLVNEKRDKIKSEILGLLASLNDKIFTLANQIELDIIMEKIWKMIDVHNRGLKPDRASAKPLDIKLAGNDKTVVTFDHTLAAPTPPVVIFLYRHETTGYLELRANKWGPIIPHSHAPGDPEWEHKKKEYEMKVALDTVMKYMEHLKESFRNSFLHSDFTKAIDHLSKMTDDYNRLFGSEAQEGEWKIVLNHIQISKTEHKFGVTPERVAVYILELQRGRKSNFLHVYHKP